MLKAFTLSAFENVAPDVISDDDDDDDENAFPLISATELLHQRLQARIQILR